MDSRASAIGSNLRRIQDEIAGHCHRSGRAVEDVRLLAVSKRVPRPDLLEAQQAGVTYFGESYVQEALQKFGGSARPQLDAGLAVECDLIGRLQSNKVKQAVGFFSMIHGVDRLSLAKAISADCVRRQITQRVLLQVNISREVTKGGIPEDEVLPAAYAISSLPGIELCGLMCLGTYPEDESTSKAAREEFSRMRLFSERLAAEGLAVRPELSMGTSANFGDAIAEGATIVRVGTALFGERSER